MSDYLTLLEEAHEALDALLDSTHPGKGFTIRRAYLDIEAAIDGYRAREAAPLALVPPTTPASPLPAVWHREFSMAEREREVLSVLAERSLTVRELTEYLDESRSDLSVYEASVRTVVNKLFAARELDRVPERVAPRRIRYRYAKRTQLEGPIADLQRVFDDETT